MKRFLILFAVVANLVLVDAVTKELARGYLKGAGYHPSRQASCEAGAMRCASRPRVIEVIPNIFNLAYVENRGCAWGMFQGQIWPLAVFGLVALAFLIWKRKSVFGHETGDGRHGLAMMPAIAEPLLYAGIIGNVIDRLFRGYVVDMFDFHWGVHHFPCFNVADSLICIAVGLMLLASLFEGSKKA